jgi:hypothetical protein
MTRTFSIATIGWANFEAWLAAEWRKVTTVQASLGSSPKKRSRPTTPGITSRGLSRAEAAALTGLSPTAFDKARREGKYSGPTLPGGKYDRNLIEKAMDRASGLEDSEKPIGPLDAWRKTRGSS